MLRAPPFGTEGLGAEVDERPVGVVGVLGGEEAAGDLLGGGGRVGGDGGVGGDLFVRVVGSGGEHEAADDDRHNRRWAGGDQPAVTARPSGS
jgi:hypothetical protein